MATTLEAGSSRSVDDFLKKVFLLQEEERRVSTNELAKALAISAASITDMAQRLRDAGLIDYRRYYGVRLTERGQEIALRVLRRHRLIELFLVQRLGYAMHEVHDEAERLEHAVSDRFIEALADDMGQPALDPHGDPIPAADGRILQADLSPLCDLPPAQPATIRGLSATSASLLAQQNEHGFRLGALVENQDGREESDPIRVSVDGARTWISRASAATILVERQT